MSNNENLTGQEGVNFASGASESEHPFVPTAYYDPGKGAIVVQEKTDRIRVISGQVNVGLIRYLASGDSPVVPRQAIDSYLSFASISTPATSAIDNASYALGAAGIIKHYGERGGKVIAVELPEGIHTSLRTSLQTNTEVPESETRVVDIVTSQDLSSEAIEVIRTGTLRMQRGGRHEEVSIQAGGRRQLLFLPFYPARYLEILGGVGNEGMPASRVAGVMELNATRHLQNVYTNTTRFLTEADAAIRPERYHPYGRSPWHRLKLVAGR